MGIVCGRKECCLFGLSGTGKTTLSTDPKRLLIGDDEHGWDDNGVFNFEGGCYAKVINLDKESEPDIYNAIRRDALLENVTVDANGKIDFADKSVTENTRVSYPIYHINNIKPGSSAWDPTSPVFIIDDTLCIPTVFISYTGEALDYKAPLLRSLHAVNVAATEVCHYFNPDVKKVISNRRKVRIFCFLRKAERRCFSNRCVSETLSERRPYHKGHNCKGAIRQKGHKHEV